MLTVKNIDNFKKILSNKCQKFMIVPHVNPDGDAIGSTLGLYHFLKNLGHQPYILSPNEYPYYLAWLPEIEKTYFANQLSQEQIFNLVRYADVICCLDFNAIKRAEGISEQILNSSKPIFMIDHHETPEGFADIVFHDNAASSTCEMVFRLIEELKLLNYINIEVATCLYTGIVTDTGCFRYSLSERVHEIAGILLQKNIDLLKIHNYLFNNTSEERLRFLGYMLKDRLKVYKEYKFAYFVQTLSDEKQFQLREGDSEGIVNYALSISGIELACYITEKEGHTKFSFRSLGKVPAIFFAKYFGGGGHHNAAGAKCDNLSIQDAENQLLELVKSHQNLIHSI
jgi:phosphoesterase RecJ-like protein